MIITIGRECGSDGYTVGKELAQIYQIPIYSRKELIEKAKETGVYERMPNFFSEKPVNSLLYAIAAGEEMTDTGKIPLEALKSTVGEGDCIVIGRCGNFAFRDRADCISVFLHGAIEARIQRMMEYRGIDRKEAKRLIEKTDRRRASFQKYYTGEIWGEADRYDLCLDSARLGIAGTVQMIQEYIRRTL